MNSSSSAFLPAWFMTIGCGNNSPAGATWETNPWVNPGINDCLIVPAGFSVICWIIRVSRIAAFSLSRSQITTPNSLAAKVVWRT
ncbi:hypothetical protein D3C76_1212540 [compost metagenome]